MRSCLKRDTKGILYRVLASWLCHTARGKVGYLDKGTKDLLVIIVIMVVVIAGFYIVLRMGIDFSEAVPDSPMP